VISEIPLTPEKHTYPQTFEAICSYHLTLIRRAILPGKDQFTSSIKPTAQEDEGEPFLPRNSPLDRVVSYIFVLAIVIAIATAIFVITSPKENEKFTEFYILDPEGMASNYPVRFPAGEPQTLIIGIRNQEYRDVTYTVETLLLQQTFDPNSNTSIIYTVLPLHTFSTTLPHDETREFLYNFTVPNTEYNRLQFLLFNETMPSDEITGSDRISTSYRNLHLWIEVQPRI
jgi:uncharacterized membrane protein